jgi:hypothetical protein
MSVYGTIIFLHVVCVLGMFSALALEGLSLRRVRGATSVEQAREWTRVWSLLLPIGMPSLFGALGSGVYLAATIHAWELSWVQLALPCLVLVAIAGALVGPKRARAAKALETGTLSTALRDPLFEASWRFRAALLTGVVYAMTARPPQAWPIAIAAGLIGLLLAGLSSMRRTE